MRIVLALMLAATAAAPRRPSPSPSASAADAQAVMDALTTTNSGLTYGVVKLGSVEPGDFLVLVSGPAARVSMTAQMAAKEYRTYTLQDGIRDYALDRSVTIAALPAEPALRTQGWIKTGIPKEIVLQPLGVKTPATTVRALRNDVKPRVWSNAMGMQLDGGSITATFPADVFSAFSPSAAIEVVVLAEDYERRYVLSHARRATVK